MTTLATSAAQNGKAVTTKKAFSQETSVSIRIHADASTIWALLTNASDFPRWNSTITSLEGSIEVGQKIHLKSVLDDKRTFKIKIRLMEAPHRMVWGDSQGERVFTLTPNEDGSVTFSMREKIGGLMFPMYKGYLPPFEENFEQYARDLKNEAETIANLKN
ncbi:SRPBCC domain-containing protein [bacterium SCSIO 12741]|nr:SRPBCC domain-containing protein [bacterium SCSIO 12741]